MMNAQSLNEETINLEEGIKKEVKKRAKKEKDPFMALTDRIIESRGEKPKEFEKRVIREARQKLYEEFLNTKMEDLIKLVD